MMKKVLRFSQKPTMTTAEYYKEFNLLVKIAKKNHASFFWPTLTSPIATLNADKAKSEQRLLAIIFIMNSDHNRFAKYKEDLSNSFSSTKDEYPITLQAAFSALDQFKFNPNIYTRTIQGSTKQVKTTVESDSTPSHSFFQQATTGPTKSKPTKSSMTTVSDEDTETTTITCYTCNRPGHISPECTHHKTGWYTNYLQAI